MGKINFLSLETGMTVSKLFLFAINTNRRQFSNKSSSMLNLIRDSVLLFVQFFILKLTYYSTV